MITFINSYLNFIFKYLVAILVVCFLVSCGGSSSDDAASSSSSPSACNAIGLHARVINGDTCDDPLRSSVVRLLALDQNGQTLGSCSGTLITPTQVLTAAHCFASISHYVVVAGAPGNISVAQVTGLSVAPGFRAGGPQTSHRLFNDVAIVTLDRVIPSPIMPILISREPQVGEAGYVYGYGRTVVGFGPDQAAGNNLEGGAMTIRNVTPNHLFVSFSGQGVNVCNGDSGGPIIIAVNGQPAVAGVTSQGSENGCQAGDVTTFINLQSDSIIPWLIEVAPDALAR